MSSKKLHEASHKKYGRPEFPETIDPIQSTYETRRFKNRPITEDFLKYATDDFSIFFSDVKFDPDFVTEDGTHWYGISFPYPKIGRCKIAFPKDEDPKHRDGTVSAHHVALFVLTDEDELAPSVLKNIGQACYAGFQMAYGDYRWK